MLVSQTNLKCILRLNEVTGKAFYVLDIYHKLVSGKRGCRPTLNFHHTTQPFIIKIRSASGGLCPLTRSFAPGPNCGQSPQTPVIGSIYPRYWLAFAPLLKLLNPPVQLLTVD